MPEVKTDTEGTITVELRGYSVYVTGEFSDLSSQYVGSHIHKGGKEENGEPILTLKPKVDPERT